MAQKNYLNNSAILREIQNSKMSYCAYADFEYTKNVLIVEPKDFKKLKKKDLQEAANNYNKKLDLQVNSNRISKEEADKLRVTDKLIVRVMTDEHLPDELKGKKTSKVKFPPFKHYMWVGGLKKWKEVLRSQWEFGEDKNLEHGHFNQDQGALTGELIKMMMTLAERYCKRPNLKGYSFVDEMIQESTLHLCQFAILKFNEYKSENPFAYGSQSILNICRQIISRETKYRQIKDDYSEEMGNLVSWEKTDAASHSTESSSYYDNKRARSEKSYL